MILFDWKKILNASKGKERTIMKIIDYLTYHTVPKSKKDELYELIRWDYYGASFLRNPEKLLENQYKYRLEFCSQYVALASLRNLGLYKLTKEVRLPVDLIPERLCVFIPQNPLLKCDPGSRTVIFKYEE